MINRPIRLHQGTADSWAPATVGYNLPQTSTTRFEQSLIFITVVILPLESQFPTLGGMSVSFLIFAMLGLYVIVNRPRTLGKIWCHSCFIAAYVFIGVSVLLEYSSPLSKYVTIIRFGQMIAGAVCIATLCRDRSALVAGLYGYLGAALWVSVFLYLTSYGTLHGMGDAADFNEASKFRTEAFADMDLVADLNGLAMVCGQGAIVALALALSNGAGNHRILFFGIGIFCLVASFLPMSRGGAMASLVGLATILYAGGFRYGKVLVLAGLLGMLMYVLVPDAVWSRMAFSTETTDGRLEGRAWIYTTALNRLPEYIVAGVGAGNYFGDWGIKKGFLRESAGIVYGAHNSLLQITLFWGILGLLMYLWIIWCIYRTIPWRCGRDGLSLALLGIMVSLGLHLLQTHGFYEKAFALGMGMLIGARQWIWSSGIVSAVEVVDVEKEAVL